MLNMQAYKRSAPAQTVACLLVFAMAVCACLCLCPACGAASEDGAFLAGLRERRLYRLAEQYCLQRIDEAQLSLRQRTELAVELARTYAEHAVQTPPEQRDAFWQKAHQVAADYRTAFPDSPRLILVDLQDALTHLARGELLRQEAALSGRPQSLLDGARKSLRQAVRGLAAADEQLNQLLRMSLGRQEEDGLTGEQLQVLARSISYQLAKAFRNQGQCYPPQSPDWTNSLSRALQRLTPLAETAVADGVVWQSRLDRVECLRLLERHAAAQEALAKIDQADPPDAIKWKAQAQRVRLLLAAERYDALGDVLRADLSAKATAAAPADFCFAQLEAAVALWRRAAESEDEQAAANWQEAANRLAEQIKQRYGPYWMRRAETLLAYAVSGTTGGSAAAHLQAAESFYRGGQFAAALEQYDQAYDLAVKENDASGAFKAGFAAAALERERKQYHAALERFRQVALQRRDHPQAGQSHLAAVFTAAQAAQAAEGHRQQQAMAAYETLLEEHIKTWPQAASASEARFWLGRLLQARGDLQRAAALYQEIDPAHERFPAAVDAVEDCYDRLLAGLRQRGETARFNAQLAGAIAYFQHVVFGDDNAWPRQWTPPLRSAALAAARLRLQHRGDGFAAAERLLRAALEGGEEAGGDWQAEARVLLVIALAGQKRPDEAATLLEKISTGPPRAVIAMQQALADLASAASPDAQRELARLELQAAELVAARAAELSPEEQRQFASLRAAALLRSGQREKALAEYRRLAKAYPRDGELQEALAVLLSESDAKDGQEAALERFRQIEQKSRRGTDRWFRAREGQARMLLELGRNDEAAKLIRLTKILHPQLGGSKQKLRFEELLRQAGE